MVCDGSGRMLVPPEDAINEGEAKVEEGDGLLELAVWWMWRGIQHEVVAVSVRSSVAEV